MKLRDGLAGREVARDDEEEDEEEEEEDELETEDSAEAVEAAVDEKEHAATAEWETAAMAARRWLRVTEEEREEWERDATDREEAAAKLMLLVEERSVEAEHIREAELHVRMAARPNMASLKRNCSAAQRSTSD